MDLSPGKLSGAFARAAELSPRLGDPLDEIAHEPPCPVGKLYETEEIFRLASLATQDVIWDWDLLTDRVRWNAAVRDCLGFDLPDLETDIEWWFAQIHPDDQDRVGEDLAACFAGDGRLASEYRMLRADGSSIEVLDRGYVIRDHRGTPVRMVGAMLDNSERFAAHRALQEREARLSTIFGQAMVGIMHRSLDGELLMVNQRFCELLGRTEDELRVLAPESYTHPDDLKWNVPAHYDCIERGQPLQIEKRYVRPDGSIVWCKVNVSYVEPTGSEVGSVLVIAQDITSRKEAEEALAKQSDLLRTVVDSVADFIFVKDTEGRFVLTNRALDDGCGELTGTKDEDTFDEDLTCYYRSVDREVMETRETRSVEEIIPVKGEQRLFQTVKVPWQSGDTVKGIIGVSRDITDRKASELAVRESEMLYRSVLEASPDCITIVSLDGSLEFMNPPGLRAIEVEDKKLLIGRPWASFWPADARRQIETAVASAARGKTKRFFGFCPTAKGNPRWWDVLVSPMRDESGQVVRILAIARDITEQRATAAQLEWASEHDPLTGLPNRRAFEARLQAATIRAMESGGEVGLLLLDLDHFKHVNDTLGHAAGDHLLLAMGKRLKRVLRSSDFVARLGGDEFAIILETPDVRGDPLAIGHVINDMLRRPFRFEGRHISASTSIGGALFPRDADNAHDLLKNADIALYALKESGRGGTRMFHNHMREQAQLVASQLSLARTSISEASVEPHYQQKVDLRTGKIAGFEALLRWRHPRRGLQLPDTVSEAFKDYELASKIGDLMQSAVFDQVRQWLNQDLPVGFVAINAAPAEFLRDDFAERIIAKLLVRDIPPALIEVEVTEHVFLDRGSDYVGRALTKLHQAGVRIALDDFGTGHSSLTHLRDYPVDVVKIDRSFVEKMTTDDEVKAIVSAVVGLARSLKMDVVAEGVESLAQQQQLVELGCQLGQGYYFGQPVPDCEVPALLKSRGQLPILAECA